MLAMKKAGENNIFNVFKPIGISPLDAIKALKEKISRIKGRENDLRRQIGPIGGRGAFYPCGKRRPQKEKYLKLDKGI